MAMVDIRQTETYRNWFADLRDERARARIDSRIYRLQHGNPGDIKSVGGGVSELRIDYGPGYRVYITRRGAMIVVLLCGGDKSTQVKDIEMAKSLAKLWSE